MAGYDDLYRWSIAEPAQFWAELARFADIRAAWVKDAPVIENPAGQMPGARLLPRGARLNFAENLLRYRDAQPPRSYSVATSVARGASSTYRVSAVR